MYEHSRHFYKLGVQGEKKPETYGKIKSLSAWHVLTSQFLKKIVLEVLGSVGLGLS